MRAMHHALAMIVALPCAAYAAGDIRTSVPELRHADEAVQQSTAQSTAQAIGPAVDAAGLKAYRGGTDTITNVLNNAQLSGAVAENAAVNVITGANAITEGAFANTTGMPTVIQNTGANVLIQNAMIVNLQFK